MVNPSDFKITSPVNNQIDWDSQELKAKFPKTPNEIPIPIPHPEGCLLLINGQVTQSSQRATEVQSPMVTQDQPDQRIVISQFEMASKEMARNALECAEKAYQYGRGTWASMRIHDRCKHMEQFANELEQQTDEIAQLLLWEIAKNTKDAREEVVRTVAYIRTAIREALQLSASESRWHREKNILCQIRHLPIGTILASSPFNYPLNEAYTTFIPGLLMGNSVIVRAPRKGATPHFPTLSLFARHFPPGVMQILTGSGKEIMSELVQTGRIDAVAFIGTAKSARNLLAQASNPHRLHVMYEGEAKDAAILLPDADLKVAAESCAAGMSSFNGQRCTALKIIWVHQSVAQAFLDELCRKVDSLGVGMPWDGTSKITPLCEDEKPGYVKELIVDAINQGAHIVNRHGGKCWKTLCSLTILAPVNKHMRIWREEQFAPVTPVAIYSDIQEPIDYVSMSEYGLQCAVFGYEEKLLARVVNALAYHVGRLNINAPDQRGPDVFPFSGRGNSALGILNAAEGLKHFSIPTMVATKSDDDRNVRALKALNEGENCRVVYGAE